MPKSLAYWRHRFLQTDNHIGQLMSREERKKIVAQARAHAGGKAKAEKMKMNINKHSMLASKDEVMYRVGDETNACLGCEYFEEDDSSCEMVVGYIDPRATCDLFTPEEEEEVEKNLTAGDVHVDGIMAERKKKKKMQYQASFSKFDDDKQIVYGIALEPYTFDTQGDWETPEDIEATAHEFMKSYRTMGIEHEYEHDEIYPVESYIAPFDFEWERADGSLEMVKKGSWILGSKVEDSETWADVKKNELNGYSVQGNGMRDASDEDWPNMWYFDGLIPVEKREVSAKERENADESSFAGKNRSFPILKPADVMAALHSIGRAGNDNYDSDTLRKNIISIARKKGFTLPKNIKEE